MKLLRRIWKLYSDALGFEWLNRWLNRLCEHKPQYLWMVWLVMISLFGYLVYWRLTAYRGIGRTANGFEFLGGIIICIVIPILVNYLHDKRKDNRNNLSR
jgi:hypothetical protein